MSLDTKKSSRAYAQRAFWVAFVFCLSGASVRAAPLTQTLTPLSHGVVTDTGADQTPSLSVERLIREAVARHPVVLSARSQEKASVEDLNVARLQRYPSLSIQSEQSSNARANVVSVEQPIWNGGRLQARIDSAASTSSAYSARTQESLYEIALRVVDAWQSWVRAHERAREITATLAELQKYSDLMQRRVDAKVSAPIDMELVVSRTLQVKVDLQLAMATQRIAQGRLAQLLGAAAGTDVVLESMSLDRQAATALAGLRPDLADRLEPAVNHHPSVRKAAQQSDSLRYDLEAQKAAQWPEVYARAQKQFATSGPPSTSSTVFLGLRYQSGAGFSSLALAKSAQARLEGAEQSVEAVRRDIRDQIQADLEELASTKGRVGVLQQASGSSSLVLDSYVRQFVAGRRTWQEVLNAVRENGDNRLAVVDAQSLLLGAAYRTRVRMGDLDWQQGLPEVSRP